MPPRALLLVDLQNDFCAGGALAVPEGDSTVDVANRLIDWCQSRGEAVIASQDWHPANHGSFASQHGVEPYTPGQLDGLPQTFWPDHCVQNSEGAQLHPLLKQKAIAAVFHKGENPLVDSYSAFFDNGRRQKTALDDWLRAHVINELIVMGLATDY
ncbi:bifunctional nicotinamidase/pyrazinamidase, partial [Escherichia coli]